MGFRTEIGQLPVCIAERVEGGSIMPERGLSFKEVFTAVARC